jgi:hypothetical protein
MPSKVGSSRHDERRKRNSVRSFIVGLLLGTLGPIVFDRLRNRMTSEVVEEPSLDPAATRAEPSTEQPRRGEGAATDDLSQLTASELYRRAQTAGIAGRSSMSKAQLIAALQSING